MDKLESMVEEVKSIISDTKYGYWEEDVYAIRDYGYDVDLVYEIYTADLMWERVVEHIFEIKKDNISFYIAVEVSLGLTETIESAGITNVYQVHPVEVTCTKWVVGREPEWIAGGKSNE